MIVTMTGLRWSRGNTGLWNMIWDQGVLSFVTAVIANLVPAVVLMVDLNPIMNIIFSIPAIATTATVSTRCFVRLSEYASQDEPTPSAMLYVDMTLQFCIVLPLYRTSLNGAKPWTKRIARPTASGLDIEHQPTQTIQFARRLEWPPHVGIAGVVDISPMARTHTRGGGSSDYSSSHFSPYSYNGDKFGEPRSAKEPEDFV